LSGFIKETCALLSRGSVLFNRTYRQRYNATHIKTKNKRSEEKMTENSKIVFIGRKPAMSYVLAIITSLSAGNAKEITLKARGQAITTAVDVAEITRSRFLKDLKVSKIAIGTEQMPAREGENSARMVSTMEITLQKD
jgi:archaea-specific DNA-binding protein